MRNGHRASRYAKLIGELALVTIGLVGLRWLIADCIGGQFEWWFVLCFLGLVLVMVLGGWCAFRRVCSFFKNPVSVAGQVDLKTIDKCYERDDMGAYTETVLATLHNIHLGEKEFTVSQEIYNWVAVGDTVTVKYFPDTDDVTWVSDEAAKERDLGEDHCIRGEYGKAIGHYTLAITRNPYDADSFCGRGIARDSIGMHTEAIADFTKALRLMPKHPDTVYNQDQWDTDMANYKRSAYVLHYRGIAYLHKGENFKAIAECTKAIELDSKLAEAYKDRGIAYALKGDYDRAIADCTKAIELDSKLAGAYMLRAHAYAIHGKRVEAIDELTRFTRLSKDPGLIKQAKQEIEYLRSKLSK